MIPSQREIDEAIDALAALGCSPGVRDRLRVAEGESRPVATPDARRERRAARRRKKQRKEDPTEYAIDVLTRAGCDPSALLREVEEAKRARRPPEPRATLIPVNLPEVDPALVEVPRPDFAGVAVDQAVATLVNEGLDSSQAADAVASREEDVISWFEQAGRDALANGPPSTIRISATTSRVREMLRVAFVEEVSPEDQSLNSSRL